jgi:hypothetical protein
VNRVRGPSCDRILGIAALLALAACESPVLPEPVPRSLRTTGVLHDQFGVPGEAAFHSPHVFVYSQYGHPLRDVLVRFAVSHGSIERSEAISDSLGFATPGTWTLRSSEGEDVLTVTVDGVEPLRFRSRVRVPVEVAYYALEGTAGRKVPIHYGDGSTTTGGSLSFYQDDTWIWRSSGSDPDGTPHTRQMQGSYSSAPFTFFDSEVPVRALLISGGVAEWFDLEARVLGNRLDAYWSSWDEAWEEAYVKVRSVVSWP